ncbi:uncharacterized protein GGS22DRAFT_166378 [Annulohypoxylon maeteangense]|uniref:uncharacterized protein n=1 Tax=Annulohypoxylon maeteangense TaxID=1927788 RepID=UPI002008180E|nr:uncharacterized protein GGS22DRAFT_166378 [Annulohypoxylon maeteangense]KAI0883910.1 hypothetical protein GGS22DRAFT_166378 [Annulohypoxylon maeteangense]
MENAGRGVHLFNVGLLPCCCCSAALSLRTSHFVMCSSTNLVRLRWDQTRQNHGRERSGAEHTCNRVPYTCPIITSQRPGRDGMKGRYTHGKHYAPKE